MVQRANRRTCFYGRSGKVTIASPPKINRLMLKEFSALFSNAEFLLHMNSIIVHPHCGSRSLYH